MNEITWGCPHPHCNRLNMVKISNVKSIFQVDDNIKCQHCHKKAIITKIRMQFETRKHKQ